MTYIQFLELVGHKEIAVAEATLRLWHHVYLWVLEHEYADTADSPEFVKYIRNFRLIGEPTIGRHLRSMSSAGILKRHTLRRKLSTEAKEELLNPIINTFYGGINLPSTFARYCLPGKPCSREFKSATRSLQRIEDRMQALRGKNVV